MKKFRQEKAVGELKYEAILRLQYPPLFRPLLVSEWPTSPDRLRKFNLFPAKGRNMWRDLERICPGLSLPPIRRPEPFPQNSILAARVALIYLLEPIFGALFSVLLGHDKVTAWLVVGGGLILGGNLLVELPA